MICPTCHTDDPAVYVGFSTSECPNSQCQHYKGVEDLWEALLSPNEGVFHALPKGAYITVLRLASLDLNPRWGAYYYKNNTDMSSGIAPSPQRALEILSQQTCMEKISIPSLQGVTL